MLQPPMTRAAARFALAAAVAGAVTALAAGAAADRAPAAAPAAATVLEDQSFEGAFPPEGWQVIDYGVPPGQYLWARTTCTVPGGGGTASVWSVGGGTLGGGLACDGDYTAHAESDLVFGPIDATDFEDGLDVTAHIKLDLHRATDFQMCITNPGAPGGVSCFGAGVTQLDWNYFDPPIAFPQAAGMAEVYVLLRFRDRDPDGGAPHQGAYVDRVVIRGLSDSPPATATADATTAAPTPTTSATVPPSATATATAAATATATPTGAASATRTPSATPSVTAPPTATGATTAAPSPSATRTATAPATAVAPSATPSGQPGATATNTLPPPPTVVGVTSTPTPTLEPSSTPSASDTAPAAGTATSTPTVIVAPPERRIFLPYAFRRRLP